MSDPNAAQFSDVMHPLTCQDHSDLRLVWVSGFWRCPNRACKYTQGMPERLRGYYFPQPELTQEERDYLKGLGEDD